jgi:radical SAM protein with 4Fe4S-binding SPASM domain
MSQLLTHSRQAAFKLCRKKHYFSYEIGLRKETSGRALRMGSAFHDGVEQLGNGHAIELACDAVRNHYALCPENFDQLEWYYEQETVLRLVCAYDWRWQTNKLEYLAVELPFQIPLKNPKTGRTTPNFEIAGKIDAIVRLEDGRLAVKETKLFGEDIKPDAEMWRLLRMDQQISLYIIAARELGYDCDTVLYDVARKPGIKPELVPILDQLGVKIVLDANGERVKTKTGLWRTTASTADGYVVQSKPMTPEEWGEKLSSDIAERPQYYFCRQEIARLDQDLREYQCELWDVQQAMRDAQKNNAWYRTVNKNTCKFCDYFDLCSKGCDPSAVPPGFRLIDDKHPELSGRQDHVNSTTAITTITTAETVNGYEIPGFDPGNESYW